MKHRVGIAIVLLNLVFAKTLFSQDENLPIGLAPGEERLIPWYAGTRSGLDRGIKTPPPFAVRAMGEWEEIQAICLTYTSYKSTVREIIRYAQPHVQLIVHCSDSNALKSELATDGIAVTSNLKFIIAPYNTIWIRDYGASTCYKDDVDSLILVDWIYNRPRPKDDTIPDVYSSFTGIPLYSTSQAPYDIVHTGGNYMVDGFGTAFSSKLLLDENGPGSVYNQVDKTEAEVDSILEMFMGINRYIKMETLPYDGIHHIDMHMRLMDEETLLVGEYPAGIADGPQIEANLQYVLSNFNSVYGTPYKVVRIPMPPDQNNLYPHQNGKYRTYTNMVFANKLILVPTYEQEFDTTALRIIGEIMPGYDVQGIDCNSIIPAGGALHCITREIGADFPLLISHQSLDNTTDEVNPYTVSATIIHKSGIDSATVYYTTDTSQAYLALPMTNSSGNTWEAGIPAQPLGTEVFYYIKGHANSGKVQVRPLAAPDGYFHFHVETPVIVEAGLPGPEVSLSVFPNPAAAITCIPVTVPRNESGRLILLDIHGRIAGIIYEGNFSKGESKYFFDAGKYSAGTYLLLLDTESGRIVKRVIVR